MNDNNNGEAPAMAPGSNRIKALAACYNSAATTSHIPLPQWKPAPDSRLQNGDIKWRSKYEEAEKKRKTLLTQSQKSERELADLERRYQLLHNDHNCVKKQLADKDARLLQLQTVSEKVYREYEALKNKHDVQTRVMQDAMKSASQWYMQNRELKRKSAVLAQKFLKEAPMSITDIADEADTGASSDGELDNLLKTIKDLSEEVGQLQAELSAARLQEFEAQEQAMSLGAQLDEERGRRTRAETELQELRAMKQNLGRVSRLVASEMTALRELCEHEKQQALRMRSEADQAQKERNVLKHQSALLLADVIGDEKVMLLLQEVEVLKTSLEEERHKHAAELQELQDKLEERETEAQLELLEEKLRLAESELQCALQRAEQAEKRSSQLVTKVNELQDELEAKACPPPPPPPPLPPPPSMLPTPCIKVKVGPSPSATDTGSNVETGNPVLDMANILGIPRKTSTAAALPGGAIDDIINQIKGGKFTLKATEKQKEEKKEEPPAAMQEMLNILGTLKRRRRNPAQQSRWPPPADVAL
ncbi:shootin-1-like [Periplaneta americana]|uniref:shootin-1-like n=1 Tax=Periplaneta americana TaxID=6978 RepID=UPI0037E72A4E